MLWSKDIEWLDGCKNNRLQETHFQAKDKKTKVKGWRNVSHANIIQNKAEVAKLTSDKINFKTKTVTRDKNIIQRDQFNENM